MYVCIRTQTILVHARDETVTFDITLMNGKGSASVDSTVLSRSQSANRYFLSLSLFVRLSV